MTTQRVWRGRDVFGLLALGWAALAVSAARAADVTLVAPGALCRYQVPSSGADGTNWTASAFDDSAWSEGASGIGYDKDGSYAPLFGTTVANGTIDVYARFAFTVPAGAIYDSLTLRLKYEDGFIAYLNGTEVARSNAPASAVYNSVATANRSDSLAVVYKDYSLTSFLPKLQTGVNVLAVHLLNDSSGSTDLLLQPELDATSVVFTNIAINEFEAVNDSTRRNSLGRFGDWVELYNPYATNVSLKGWYLTDNAGKKTKWQFPAVTNSSIAAKGYLLVWTDDLAVSLTNKELHASFSLGGSGEYLGLVMPDGVTVVSEYAPTFPQQFSNISYGIGASGEPRYFATPTPGAANAFAGGSNQVEGVKFSPKRGVYTDALPQVTITPGAAGSAVYYTTDFSTPSSNSALYSAPLDLSHTALIRAVAYKNGLAPSEVDTHTFVSADDVLNQPALPAGFPANLWISSGNTNAPDYAMNPAVVSAYGLELTNALKALPSLSLVTTLSNLFDATTGIYTHPQSLGTNWERAISAEWIDRDNDSRFQAGCGLQIQGGAFRGFNLSLKKSFSLQFRGLYGETSLNETLFDGQSMASLDDLVLRAGANDAWNKWGHQKTQYIADEFIRRSYVAMGQWAPHGRFVHVYLDGLYWGIYNATEKVSSEMAAAVYGGSDNTWDVRSQDAALDGDYTAWNAMVKLLQTNVVDNALYQRVQGNNPDGSRNFAYPVYLDLQNYIDYLVINYWSANTDWPNNNWRAFRNRNESISTGYKFAIWDCEASLGVWGDLTTDRTGPVGQNGVATMHSNLLFNAEYRLRFADRIQKHLFNGGELSAEKAVPRYQELAAALEPALVAESARWGDQDGAATHTVDQWRAQRDYVLATFLPQRGANALQYFRNCGLYPTNAAPAFSPFGGAFADGQTLALSASSPIYYTLDGSDPRQYGTGAAAGALYTNGIALTRATRVKARARSAATGEWSALTEAVFTPQEKPALRVTELMFHPRNHAESVPEALDGDDEFIELQNAGATPIGLAGLRLTQGVTFDFAGSPVQTLGPGEYLLVVKSLEAFTNRYPSVPAQKIAGVFAYPAQSLDDAGERVGLEDALGRSVVAFTYNNAWRPETDGAGHSLVPAPDVAQADGELDYPGNWRSSVYIGGSPGQAEPARPAATVVLNEILAHTDDPSAPDDSNDGIELYNTAGLPVSFGAGWYLSDDADNLAKWEIPATNTVAAGGWVYFDEVHDFHTSPTNGFGLNKGGDEVFLSYLPAAGAGRVVDAVRFEGEENGVPLIRYPDGAPYWVHGVPTPAAANQLAENDVLISEVMYHPAPTAANPENNENDEYVELYNPKPVPVTLKDLVENAGVWRLSGGIQFDFPDSTVLPAGGRLVVVPFDPSTNSLSRGAFLAAYGLTNGQIRLAGPCSGQLNNKSDTVRLERPVLPDAAGDPVSWHVVDQATYYDAGDWPAQADGTGLSLTRLPGTSSGEDPAGWVAGLAASPGAEAVKIEVTAPEANTGYLAPASIAVAAAVDAAFVAGSVRQVIFAVDGVDAACVSNAPYAATVALDASCEGVRLITARLADDAGDYTSPGVPVVAYTNMPGFAAGKDQTINLNVTDKVKLHAAVGAQGGTTNPVRYVWSCPGNSSVVFENPSQGNASARFSQAGQYELMLTLYYGQLVTNRFITVTVGEANTTNSIPYKESFESYEPGMTLVGVGGWYGSYAEQAVVETNRFAAGSGGAPLAGPHELSLTFIDHVTNLFGRASAQTNVCVELLVGCSAMNDELQQLPTDVQLAFCVNKNWRLMVWHGQPGSTNRWTELPDVAVPSNAFIRLTVMSESAREPSGSAGFRIWADRAAVTNPAGWFASAVTNSPLLSSLELSGIGQLDDLVVDTYNSMLYRRITASAGPHGQVVPSGEVLVPVGTSTNLSVLPDPFFRVNGVAVDGQGVGPVSGYTFTNVWDEHALAADFAARRTGSGVPEVWLNRLNPLWTDSFEAHAQADSDGDGLSNEGEYLAGTDATNALSVFRVELGLSNGLSVVSLTTVPYHGEDDGLSGLRRYALEQADSLAPVAWSGVPGLTNVAGEGQTVVYTNGVGGAGPRFFRGRVWLSP